MRAFTCCGVLAALVTASSSFAASGTPGACSGGEARKLAVEASTDGYNWQSGSLYVPAYGGEQVEISVRTLLSNAYGDTQGWSFGLEHDASDFESYGGTFELTGVTVQGTQTETVRSGGPPDLEATEIRTGQNGFTQGVVIDNGSVIRLGPVSDFVTAGACYRLTMPYSMSYYAVITLTFTHELGGAGPLPPWPGCGVDPSQDGVGCRLAGAGCVS